MEVKTDRELPDPSFRLTWRDGAYRVSKPDIAETDCYTADQLREHGESCARMAREEAAKICDAIYKDEQDEPECYGFAKECAAAIRKG